MARQPGLENLTSDSWIVPHHNKNKKPIKPLESVTQEAKLGAEDKTGYRFYNPDKTNDIIRFTGFSLHAIIILMTLFYGLLAVAYGTGQLYKLTLSDFWCPDMYTLDEIREYNALHNNTLGDEYSCYQIHGNVIDYQRLFNVDPSLSYESFLDYDNDNLVYAVLYFIVALVFSSIIVYDISHILSICLGHKLKKNGKQQNKKSFLRKVSDKYVQYMSTDTTGWVIRKFISELIEIVIQGIALLSLGGVDITDWNGNILAEESWVVVGFAIIILCNGVFNFILWICYAAFPKAVYGYPFVYSVFAADALFDTLYAVFPMAIKGQLQLDEIGNTIGQLRVTKPINFVQSILPLCFLLFACFKGLSQSLSLANKGKVDPRLDSIYIRKSIDTSEVRHGNVKYDLNGLFIKCHHDDMRKLNVDTEKEKALKKQDCIRRSILIICATFVLGLSAVLSISVIMDMMNSEEFCNQFTLSTININRLKNIVVEQNIPELVIYDEVCKLKVYKLFSNYPCNCKLVMFENSMMTDSESTICKISADPQVLFNFTSIDIINNIFMKWDNMIRIWIDQQLSTTDGYIGGCVNSFDEYLELQNRSNVSNSPISNQIISFDRKEMFAAKYIQLFYIRNLHIEKLTIEIADHFTNLQYFSVPKTFFDANDLSFTGLASLSNLKLIQLSNMNNLKSTQIDSFCNLQASLRSLHIEHSYFEDFHDCFTEFWQLEFLLLNYVGLVNINWDVLNITSLKRLSLFAAQIEFESLDNTFIATHIYNSSQSMLGGVYIGGHSPICKEFENNTFISQSATNFIQTFDACAEGCNSNECPAYNIGDGVCQTQCNNNIDLSWCNFDNGDCDQ